MKKTGISLLVLFAALPLLATDYYVSPAGTASGTGSRDNPWDVATALAQPPAVHPGDTIWLRGGTYKGHFTSSLRGSASKPIVVRQYADERATLDGNDGSNAVTLLINGSDAWFWGFEITNSNTTRISTNASQVPGRGEAVNLLGARTRLINLVIHDASQGVLTTTDIPDTEINGCLIYFNGYDGTDRGHGHGVYLQNAAPSMKRVTDNIIFDQFGIGIHAYTESGKLDGLDVEGNTSFDNGALSTVSGLTTDILIGASGSAAANANDSAKVAKNTIVRSNSTYFSGSGGTGANLGYSKGIASPTIVDNYLVGGSALALVNAFRPITMTGNFLFGSFSGFQSSEFPGNTFATSRPTGVKVVSRPNHYEPGRANITIYNWDKAPMVDVSLVGILIPGAPYELRNAQNFFGPPVLTGVYNGSPLHVPMTGLTAAVPIGRPAPPATGPDFQVFVLLSKPAPPAPRARIVRPNAPPGSPVRLVRASTLPRTTAVERSLETSLGAPRLQIFPDVASSAAGRSYATDIALASGATAPSLVTLRFLEHDRDNTAAPERSFLLAPGESRRIDDVLQKLFEADETYGAMEVEADGEAEISVAARAPAGPPGDANAFRAIAPIPRAQLASALTLVGLREDGSARTDITLVNPNSGGAAVSLTLWLAPATLLGTTFVMVPPRGNVRRPLSALFPSVASDPGENLSLSIDAGALPVYAFASVVDEPSPAPPDAR